MLEWLKEHVWQVIAGAALVIFFLYVYLDGPAMEKEANLQQWSLIEETERMEHNPTGEEEISFPMMADIKGEVARPGVYEIVDGDRIIDLIEKAGGLTDEAEASAINFAMKVSDEMAVYVPKKGEEAEAAIMPSGVMSAGEKEGKINLNLASAAELETLPGIGPAKSAAIIEYRESNGSFKSIEDIKNISGIGNKTFEKLESLIIVK
jgi:competence protein ComEA